MIYGGETGSKFRPHGQQTPVNLIVGLTKCEHNPGGLEILPSEVNEISISKYFSILKN